MNTETNTGFKPMRELTPEELAMLAMAPKDELCVTTDEETAEETPTLH